MFSFWLLVFVCYPSQSVRASTLTPTCGFGDWAALHSSALHRFVSESFHILSFALQIEFCNSAVTLAVTADLHLILISFPIWLLIAAIFLFHHHVHWGKIAIFLAEASVTCQVLPWTTQLCSRYYRPRSPLSNMRFLLPTLWWVSQLSPSSSGTLTLGSTRLVDCVVCPPGTSCPAWIKWYRDRTPKLLLATVPDCHFRSGSVFNPNRCNIGRSSCQ
jgi:hypothetical protein